MYLKHPTFQNCIKINKIMIHNKVSSQSLNFIKEEIKNREKKSVNKEIEILEKFNKLPHFVAVKIFQQ